MPQSVLEKLGYRAGAPARLFELPSSLTARIAAAHASERPSWIIAFVLNKAGLANAAHEVSNHYRRGGHLWFAYPKKAGAIRTDISRNEGWAPLNALDLLPVTQIAIDGT